MSKLIRTTIVLALGLVPALCAAESQQEGMNQVLAAWKTRAEKFRTLRIKCSVRLRVAKSFYMRREARPSRKTPANLDVPAQDTTYNNQLAVVLDKKNVRFERDEHVTSSDTGVLHTVRTVSVQTTELFLRLEQCDSRVYPQGYTNSNPFSSFEQDDFQLMPVLMAVRPFHPLMTKFTHFSNRFEVVPGKTKVADRPCIELREKKPSRTGYREHIFVDSERDFAIVQYSFRKKGVLKREYAFSDFVKTAGSWFPKKWRRTSFFQTDDKESVRSEVTVTDLKVNEPVKNADFQLAFPSGTWVRDGIERGYIVLKDGSKRRVLRKELIRGALYGDLLKTRTGEARADD